MRVYTHSCNQATPMTNPRPRGTKLGELFSGATSPSSTIQLNQTEALIAIALLSIAADDDLSEEERGTFAANQARIFNAYTERQTQESLNKVLNLIEQQSSSAVFAAAKRALTPQLRETAFAIATDLVLADGNLTNEEKSFLEKLWGALDIPANDGQKIIDVMVIKNCL